MLAMLAMLAWLASLALSASCRRETPSQTAASEDAAQDPRTVAVFDGGAVTLDQLDAHVLSLSPAERSALGSERMPALVRRLASDHLLLAAAQAEGPGAADEAQRETLMREALAHQCLVETLLAQEPPASEPTEDALRASYQRHAATFHRPEQRLARNIFLRRTPQRDSKTLAAELDKLRARVLEGESFRRLASAVSESETRHQGGEMGWIQRGQLPPALEAILFALPERVPSEPIINRDGGHLFWIETVLEAQDLRFEEAREAVRRLVFAERREQRIERIIQRIDRPTPERFEPTADELLALLSGGQAQAPVLRIGDFTLSVDMLRAKLAAQAAAGTEIHPQTVVQLVGQLRRREILFQHCRGRGITLGEPGQAWVERQREAAQRERFRRQRLEALMDRDPEALRDFYARNRNRFSTPLELELERVRIPLGPDASRDMARLEAMAGALAAGRLDSAAVAQQLGGEVEMLGWKSLANLARWERKMVRFVAEVPAGSYAAPYRTEQWLNLVHVIARREPRARSFEQAKASVRAAFFAQHEQALDHQLEDSLLQAAHFRLLEQRLHPPAADTETDSSPSTGPSTGHTTGTGTGPS